MRFKKHLFISYAHLDNQILSSEEQGWISRFHVSLESLLSMRLGGRARIWRDTKLSGNDIFGDEIVDQFPETAVLVSIISPRYLRSEWCTKEVREFIEAASETGGVIVGNKARIFKVIKTPVESQELLPHVLKGALGYQFFTLDEQERPIELDPAFGKELERDYLRKINAMAWDISEMLTRLDKDAAKTLTGIKTIEPVAPKPSIYLAECSYDRREDREKILAELKAHGYSVLPDENMPTLEKSYVAKVSRLLKRCNLSIHLIGQSYGLVPDGPSGKSGTVLQSELAVEKSKSDGLQRLVWLPEGTRSEHPQQQAFIEDILEKADVQFGADVIAGDLEDLKSSIHDQLKKLEETASAEAGAQDPTKPVVYLAECSYDRREDRSALQKVLTVEGYTVLPHHELPKLETDYVAEMDRDLNRSKLSIHMIGQGYGMVPDGPSHKSGVVFQNERAVEKSKSDGLQRVIWLPEGTHSEQAQQRAFIEALHQDAEVRFGAEVITGSLEELQATVIDTLKQIEKPKPTQTEAADDEEEHRKMVYVICDEKDRKKTIPVRKFLKRQHFEVHIPLFQGDADAVQEAQQEDLSTCDAIIVFYGQGDEAWKRSIDNELKKK